MEIISAIGMFLKLVLFLITLETSIIFSKKNKYKSLKSLIIGFILLILNLLCCVALANEFTTYKPIFEVNSIVWGIDVILKLICLEVDYNKKKLDDSKKEEA